MIAYHKTMMSEKSGPLESGSHGASSVQTTDELETSDEGRTRPLVVEYHVSNARMTLIRQHRWEADYGRGEVLAILREYAWSYTGEEYREWRTTMTAEITESGTVEHDGRPLGEYAASRVRTLTNKRRVHEPDTVRTELVEEPISGGLDR